MGYCYLLLQKKKAGWEACKLHTPISDAHLTPGCVRRCGSCGHFGPRNKAGKIRQEVL